ncbi:MAG: mechanosensitive ion channel family protein [Rhodobacteraceae bacterium]|nr:mechanosensitive ion channel family protein [Paracoccaceae bacterium]
MMIAPHFARRMSIAHVARALLTVLIFVFVVLGVGGVHTADAQQEDIEDRAVTPLSTDSPRDVLRSFLLLRDEMEAGLLAYTTDPTRAGAQRLALLSDQMVALFDLDLVPRVARREVGIETATYLMDIFGRIDPPALDTVPDNTALDDESISYFRILGTPLRIMQMTDGDREGEFLFSGRTVQAAPRFLRSLRDIPLRSPLEIESYSAFSPQLTGPLIPASVLQGVPASLKTLWFGTPAWKVLTMGVLTIVSMVVLAKLYRAVSAGPRDRRMWFLFLRALVPLAMLFAVLWALPYIMHQINVSGGFSNFAEKTLSISAHVAFAWLFWIVVRMMMEWVILSPRIPDESLDANLLRLVSGVIGIIGAAIILAFGGQAIGLPIVSVLAGLGIGGLAVALALRPTLENLVGGVMLYIDRPVRVGDFCCFEGQTGTVEGIGIRSTRLRALDRTLITVPNAQFADMQIINFTSRDQILIDETVGLRYETTPDQLRTLLTRIRTLFIEHPDVDSKTVRVRFSGYGDSALEVNFRIYVMTTDWETFVAIREEMFLSILDIVSDCGTEFAFSSQTLYLSRDKWAREAGLQDGRQAEPTLVDSGEARTFPRTK